MRSPRSYILIIICASTMSASCVFADQVAVTSDGRDVHLRDDGTWKYITEGKEKVTFINLSREVSEAVRPMIDRRDNVLAHRFKIVVNYGNPAYEVRFESVMLGLKRYCYQYIDKHNSKKFGEELVEVFGADTANNIVWLLEHWDFWED